MVTEYFITWWNLSSDHVCKFVSFWFQQGISSIKVEETETGSIIHLVSLPLPPPPHPDSFEKSCLISGDWLSGHKALCFKQDFSNWVMIPFNFTINQANLYCPQLSLPSPIPYPWGLLGHHWWLHNQFPPFFCSPLPSGTWGTQTCTFPYVVFPSFPLSALSSFPFHCALQDGFSQTWWTGDLSIPRQFASLYDGQVFVWSDCLLDLGTNFLIGNMVFVGDA